MKKILFTIVLLVFAFFVEAQVLVSSTAVQSSTFIYQGSGVEKVFNCLPSLSFEEVSVLGTQPFVFKKTSSYFLDNASLSFGLENGLFVPGVNSHTQTFLPAGHPNRTGPYETRVQPHRYDVMFVTTYTLLFGPTTGIEYVTMVGRSWAVALNDSYKENFETYPRIMFQNEIGVPMNLNYMFGYGNADLRFNFVLSGGWWYVPPQNKTGMTRGNSFYGGAKIKIFLKGIPVEVFSSVKGMPSLNSHGSKFTLYRIGVSWRPFSGYNFLRLAESYRDI